jgi:hypothetical protein
MIGKHKIKLALLVILLAGASFYFIYFPGQQSIIAFKLATGIGVSSLQQQVVYIEKKILSKVSLSSNEKSFLNNLYTCFWKGAYLTVVLRQSAHLMRHYLSCKGGTIEINPRIFRGSRNVQIQQERLRKKILTDINNNKTLPETYRSAKFQMADPEFYDSFIGLYYGTIEAKVIKEAKKHCIIKWTAIQPWEWPTYAHIKKHFGSYSTHNFPLPNMRSIIFGDKYRLYINDGIGAYLVELSLAEPFVAYSEWEDKITY